MSDTNLKPATKIASNLGIPIENLIEPTCHQQMNSYECGVNVIVVVTGREDHHAQVCDIRLALQLQIFNCRHLIDLQLYRFKKSFTEENCHILKRFLENENWNKLISFISVMFLVTVESFFVIVVTMKNQ